jgi:hypothetical protein
MEIIESDDDPCSMAGFQKGLKLTPYILDTFLARKSDVPIQPLRAVKKLL